jgi:hypothetical protein
MAWHCLKRQENARLALLQQRSAGISSSWLLSRFSKTARQSFVLQRGQGCSTGQQTALARLTHADSCSCRCTGWTIFFAALHPIKDSGFWALSADPSLSAHICNRLSRIVRMAHDAAEPCTMARTQCHKCLRHPGGCLTLRVWLARLSSDGGEAKCFSACAARYARPRAPFAIDLSTTVAVVPNRALRVFLIKVVAVFTSSSSLSTPSRPLPLSTPLIPSIVVLSSCIITRHALNPGQSHYHHHSNHLTSHPP